MSHVSCDNLGKKIEIMNPFKPMVAIFLILSGEIWQFLAESRHRTWSDGPDDMVNVFCTKISYTPVEIVKLS